MTGERHRASGAVPASIAAILAVGQQIWLDDLSRPLVRRGQLADAISRLGVSGVTSNPAIVARAIGASDAYHSDIEALRRAGRGAEEILFELAIGDVTAAADMLASVWRRTGGEDGWVSTQLSPRLADDAEGTIAAAVELHDRIGRPNVLIKIPATSAGLVAVEEVLVTGVPVTVTLLLTPAHVRDAASAYVRAIERRVRRGETADVRSYAALYVSRWDARVPAERPDLAGTFGVAIAAAAYADSRAVFASDRWHRLEQAGARPQTLLFASTGCRDPQLGAAHYVERLAAPGTANTIPPGALEAFAAEGRLEAPLSDDPERARAALAPFADLGIDIDVAGGELQAAAARGFSEAWGNALRSGR